MWKNWTFELQILVLVNVIIVNDLKFEFVIEKRFEIQNVCGWKLIKWIFEQIKMMSEFTLCLEMSRCSKLWFENVLNLQHDPKSNLRFNQKRDLKQKITKAYQEEHDLIAKKRSKCFRCRCAILKHWKKNIFFLLGKNFKQQMIHHVVSFNLYLLSFAIVSISFFNFFLENFQTNNFFFFFFGCLLHFFAMHSIRWLLLMSIFSSKWFLYFLSFRCFIFVWA